MMVAEMKDKGGNVCVGASSHYRGSRYVRHTLVGTGSIASEDDGGSRKSERERERDSTEDIVPGTAAP